jgi:hypothetical protein
MTVISPHRRRLLDRIYWILLLLVTRASFVLGYPNNPPPPPNTGSSSRNIAAVAAMTTNRWVLVTGGNKGIGRAVCERLLTEWTDTSVVLGSRDVARGQQAADEIVKVTRCDPSRLSVLAIDTGSDESVRQAAQRLRATLQQQQERDGKGESVKLYGIVNNAGVCAQCWWMLTAEDWRRARYDKSSRSGCSGSASPRSSLNLRVWCPCVFYFCEN